MKVDYPYWVDHEQFDLGTHIREVKLKSPANHANLLGTIGEFAESPMDKSRPM